MAVVLRVLAAEDMEPVRRWRNQCPEALRTPYLLTAEAQAAFYEEVVRDRDARSRFWAVEEGGVLTGMAGLASIEWENRSAEISLIIDPQRARAGVGTEAVELLLAEAFQALNLETVWGECYECNPALPFWQGVVERHEARTATLPRRKFWAGRYWDSLYFAFARGDPHGRGSPGTP